MRKGKIIVLEGLDSSGKATQTKLLKEKLDKLKIKNAVYSFPRYNSFFGKLISKYLKGELGEKESLPEEFVSLLYSLDRYEIKEKIESDLNNGYVILMDRYYTSNFGFQTAKKEENQKKDFLDWLKKLESRMPAPDKVLFLDIAVDFSQKLMDSRKQKDYMKEKKDIHEKDLDYQKKVRKMFLELCKTEKNWVLIKCAEENKLKTIQEIHEMIWKETQQELQNNQTK